MPDLKEPREIVAAAVQYYKAVSDTIDPSKLRLEEITRDEKAWHVTLSYPQVDETSIFGYASTRDYKEFSIDPETASVNSMKIKKI